MKIYIDADFKCHIQPGEGRAEVKTDFFDGKCDTYIEGYRFVPAGESWERADGQVFDGEMICPWGDWERMDQAQRAYEREQAESLTAQNAELLDVIAAMVEDIYQSDTEEIGG